MPIEEKPQLLEFNCTIEGMEEIIWNIKYDPNDKIGVHVSGNGQTFHCPVELFGDVTNFLRSKNILKPDVNIRTAPTPGFAPGSYSASLAPPQVEGVDSSAVVASGPPIDALASFDITSDASSLTPPKVENVSGNASPQPVTPAPTQPAPTQPANVVTAETKSEVINRPVIRTRVSGDDPQSAEKEAAAIRGAGGAGGKKTIKKKHQIVE
jgi:hypothetical protein